MFYLPFIALVGLCIRAGLAQQPVELYQRMLMIIKPNAQAGGSWVGTLTQEDIDRASEAFNTTFPQMVSEMTDGRVMIEPHVVVSDSPLTTVSQYGGMVMPENVPDDVSEYVSADQWDTVAIYNAFTEHAYWGISEAAGVGWFSVNHRTDVCYQCDAVAGWIHEMLHTMAWYFADQRLGPSAPSCSEAPDGRDGTHCYTALGYSSDSGSLPYYLGYYKDYLNSAVGGSYGLGSKAWAYGSRREASLGVSPGSTIPTDLGRRSVRRDSKPATSSDNAGMPVAVWV